MGKLTDAAIKQAKPQDKRFKLYDEHGLYLEVSPNGGKWWRLKYRLDGKENTKSLGTYPLVTLKEARDKAFEYRKQIAEGVKPGVTPRGGVAFRDVAKQWFERFMEPAGGRYPPEVWRRLEREVFPYIGDLALTSIEPPDILFILRKLEARGVIETAHKIKSYISQTMRFGVASGIIRSDPTRDLSGAIAPRRKEPMPAIIDPAAVGRLMRAIYGYEGSLVVRSALKLAALTFVRPGELRKAEWSEVDLDAAEWRIPAEKMKMKRPHIVPLSDQALLVLQELRVITGDGKYLFPSVRSRQRAMSDMTVNAALRAMGYSQNEMTGHGFRAMASSLLAEQGWSVDAIERQLAHIEKNKVRAAYHRSEHLDERRRMMQAWADYLDSLRAST